MKSVGIKGTFYDGQTSGRFASELIVDSEKMVHLHGVSFESCALGAVVVPSRVGNTARLIQLPNGCLFESSDNDAIDSVFLLANKTKPLLNPHYWESKRLYIALSLVAFVAIILVSINWGIPAASNFIAKLLPSYISESMAENTLEQLDKFYLKPSKIDDVKKSHYQTLFSDLKFDERDIPLKLRFRSSDLLGPNAFALPNGDIVLTDSLIALAEQDQEVEAVMLHEIGHVVERHSLRQVLESVGTAALFVWLTEDVEGIANLLLATPLILVHAKYSRGHEEEADNYALEGMLANNIDPEYFATIMGKISHEAVNARDVETEEVKDAPVSEGASIWHYLSSHPASQERVERFLQASEQLEPKVD